MRRLLLLLCLLPTLAWSGETADRVFLGLAEYRRDAGAAPPERLPVLDRVARERAELIASLPEKKRLNVKASLGDAVRLGGLRLFGELRSRVDLSRGYRDPASSIVAKWIRSKGWGDALDARFDLGGAADVVADDGTIVFVMLLVESAEIPEDIALMERMTHDAINAIRVENGLEPLAPVDEVREVAYAHSKDMAERDFFQHRNPDGDRPADRMRAAGLLYRSVAENIQMSRSVRNPVTTAVDAWMNSPGHRKNILGKRFTHSGIGVHIGDDGSVYFTQLFWLPAIPRE